MRIKTLAMATMAILAGSAVAGPPSFQFVKSFNLNSNFVGQAIDAVAFDGTNIYVKGFRSGSIGTIDVFKINNALGTETISSFTTIANQETNRDGDLMWLASNGSLYVGSNWGRGTAGAGIDISAIRKFDAAGNLDTNFGTSGVLTVGARIDAMWRDPGFDEDGAGPLFAQEALAYGLVGSTTIQRRNLATGVSIGSCGLGVAQANVNTRCIGFDNNGNGFRMADGGFYFSNRQLQNGSGSLAAQTTMTALDTNARIMRNFVYGDVPGFDKFIVHNQRDTQVNGVLIVRDGANPWNQIGTIDGSAGPFPYDRSSLSLAIGQGGDGNYYLIVGLGAISDGVNVGQQNRVDIYRIAPPTISPSGYTVNYGIETTTPGLARLQANDADSVDLCQNLDQEDPNPIQIEISGTNANVNPANLKFNLVCRAEANDREIYVEMFSFTLGDWVGIPSVPVTDSDALYTFTSPGTAGDFVNDGDGAMISRITGFLGAADSPTLPCWSFNQAFWD